MRPFAIQAVGDGLQVLLVATVIAQQHDVPETVRPQAARRDRRRQHRRAQTQTPGFADHRGLKSTCGLRKASYDTRMSSRTSERFSALYRLRVDGRDVQARARALALEQSIEMPLEAVTQDFIRDNVVARVESIEAAADDGGAGFDLKLSFATA